MYTHIYIYTYIYRYVYRGRSVRKDESQHERWARSQAAPPTIKVRVLIVETLNLYQSRDAVGHALSNISDTA